MPVFNKDSMIQSSIRIGKGEKYFSTMKIQNPSKFFYIKALGGGNIVLGYYGYKDARVKVVDEFLDLYGELENRRQVSAFTKRYDYQPFSVAKLGTRVLKFNLSFKVFRMLEIMNPQIEIFIQCNPKKINSRKHK